MKSEYVFEMQCIHCNRKFVSKIRGAVPCPYCTKMTDRIVRNVKVINDPTSLGKVYVDAATGKLLKPKYNGILN